MSELNLMNLLYVGTPISLKANEVLFSEGTFQESMFIILDGKMEVYKKNKVISLRGPGDFFGEMALLESKPRSASVRAVTPVELLELDKETFIDCLAPNPKILWEILKIMSQRNRLDLDMIDSGYMELKKSEEKYRNIVESVSDIILQTDPDGKIVFANNSVTLLGHEPFDMIAKPLRDFIDTENGDLDWREILTRRVGLRETSNLEIDLKINEQSTLFAMTRVAPCLVNATGIWDLPKELVKKKGTRKKFLGSLLIARQQKMTLMF